MKGKLLEDLYLSIGRESVRFINEPAEGYLGEQKKRWVGHHAGGVIVLAQNSVHEVARSLPYGSSTAARYDAVFRTTSGAVIASGTGYDHLYSTGVDEVGPQEAVTKLWENVDHEIDKIRLLMRLAMNRDDK